MQEFRKSALVIDDSRAQIRAISAMLNRMHCGAVTANSVDEALTANAGAIFDFILLDLHLKEGQSTTRLEDIRAAWPGTPVVVMTAGEGDACSDLARAAELGADMVLRKPFTPAELADIIIDVVRIRRTGRPRDHVLVIDDSSTIRTFVASALRPVHRISVAADMQVAIERMSYDKIDLVLVDMVLPGMSGVEGIRLVRRTWPSVKIIAMSGGGGGSSAGGDYEDLLIKAERMGALRSLPKPFSPRQLRYLVRATLEIGRPLEQALAG